MMVTAIATKNASHKRGIIPKIVVQTVICITTEQSPSPSNFLKQFDLQSVELFKETGQKVRRAF